MITKLTLKRAKELSRAILGRLPKCGHEFIIYTDASYRLSLVNRSGKFELSETLTPFHDNEWDNSAKQASNL